jgi:hypothetical protein
MLLCRFSHSLDSHGCFDRDDSRGTAQTGVRILDDEASLEPGNFARQAGSLRGVQHRVEILLGRGRFVLRILAAVGEDVMGREFFVRALRAKQVGARGYLMRSSRVAPISHAIRPTFLA